MAKVKIDTRLYVMRWIVYLYSLKKSQIAKDLNISLSEVSRCLKGERRSINLEIYMIEKMLGMKIYSYELVND